MDEIRKVPLVRREHRTSATTATMSRCIHERSVALQVNHPTRGNDSEARPRNVKMPAPCRKPTNRSRKSWPYQIGIGNDRFRERVLQTLQLRPKITAGRHLLTVKGKLRQG